MGMVGKLAGFMVRRHRRSPPEARLGRPGCSHESVAFAIRILLTAARLAFGDALAFNGLSLDSDERLLAGVLAGDVSGVELAQAICSPRRMGLPGALVTH